MIKNWNAEYGKETDDRSYQKAKVILIGTVGLSIVLGYKIGYKAGSHHETKEFNRFLIRFCEANPNLEEEFLKTGKMLGLIK